MYEGTYLLWGTQDNFGSFGQFVDIFPALSNDSGDSSVCVHQVDGGVALEREHGIEGELVVCETRILEVCVLHCTIPQCSRGPRDFLL
jgi:hypothetical protein